MELIIAFLSVLVLILTSGLYMVYVCTNSSLHCQKVYTLMFEPDIWKKYKQLKKYLKTYSIPYLYRGDIIPEGFAFVHDNISGKIFVIKDHEVFLCEFFKYLIEDLIKTQRKYHEII